MAITATGTGLSNVVKNIGQTVGGAVLGGIAQDGCSLLNDIYKNTIGGAVDSALNGLYGVLGNVRAATEMVAQMVGVPLAAVKKYFSLRGSGALGAMNGFMRQYPCGAAADIGSIIQGKEPLGPLKQFQTTAGGAGNFLGSIASQVGLNNLPGFGARGQPSTNSTVKSIESSIGGVINTVNKGVDSAVDKASSFIKSFF